MPHKTACNTPYVPRVLAGAEEGGQLVHLAPHDRAVLLQLHLYDQLDEGFSYEQRPIDNRLISRPSCLRHFLASSHLLQEAALLRARQGLRGQVVGPGLLEGRAEQLLSLARQLYRGNCCCCYRRRSGRFGLGGRHSGALEGGGGREAPAGDWKDVIVSHWIDLDAFSLQFDRADGPTHLPMWRLRPRPRSGRTKALLLSRRGSDAIDRWDESSATDFIGCRLLILIPEWSFTHLLVNAAPTTRSRLVDAAARTRWWRAMVLLLLLLCGC